MSLEGPQILQPRVLPAAAAGARSRLCLRHTARGTTARALLGGPRKVPLPVSRLSWSHGSLTSASALALALLHGVAPSAASFSIERPARATTRGADFLTSRFEWPTFSARRRGLRSFRRRSLGWR